MTLALTDRVWFTAPQAAEYAGCHVRTLQSALQAGELTGSQRVTGGRWRIHRDDIDAWLRGGPA